MISEEYKDINGIKVFHESADVDHQDYNAQGLDNLFQEEEKHFWFLARKEFIYEQIKTHVNRSEKVIEIGAGTGNVARFLKEKGYGRIAVGEMHNNGLQYARSYGIQDCYQFDLLRSPFKREFDAVCMFDVLEHIENDTKALEKVHHMLKQEGHIVLTVPAHQWLWNCDDEIAGHKRRYTKKELVNLLEKSGYEVVTARYFFMAIVPLLWMRKLRNKKIREESLLEKSTSGIAMNPILSKILYLISQIENKLNGYLPNLFGGSLFALAKKK